MKLSNWKEALLEEFQRAEARNFAWGSFDCALFACDAIRAQTGVDPGARFRGTYSTEKEADALIGADLETFVAVLTAQYGMAEISHGHGGRGDLILVDNDTLRGALAVVDFSGSYAVCPGTRGLIMVARHRWKRAWRVG